VLEPDRQAGATKAKEEQFIEWGSRLFAPTAEGGFNCAGCHGGMKATGGVASYNLTDPATGDVQAVSWAAPALNTIYYRFSEEEIRYILTYGRPFSPMPAWGVAGGGPMNDQQIDTLLAYLKSIQIERVDCAAGEDDPQTCPSGHLPVEVQQEIDAAARKSVEDGTYATYGEALYNLALASGAYSCARCHTPGWSWGNPGVAGQGAFGWNVTSGATGTHFPNESDMITFVKSGSTQGAKYGTQGQGTGRMPGFGNMLTDEQVEAIVRYVRSL
jgi:mono/diheme cytochrome c family protein